MEQRKPKVKITEIDGIPDDGYLNPFIKFKPEPFIKVSKPDGSCGAPMYACRGHWIRYSEGVKEHKIKIVELQFMDRPSLDLYIAKIN